ncbi:hypothetical protein AUK22_09015 [bacterium CG2_30_54_10]|nr:MAG: hypothetical protein AUK22_09015 [bacterium CG2_30_54_10]
MGNAITCALRELGRRPARTALTVSGFAFAVGLVVIMVNVLLFSSIAENTVLESTGTHFMTYAPSCGNVASLTQADIDNLLKGIIPQQCQGLCKNCTGCNKKPLDLRNEGFMANSISTRLLSKGLVDKVKALPTVKDAAPFLMFRFKDKESNLLFSVGGFDPTNPEAVGTTCCARGDLVQGEYLATSSFGQALVEEGFARNRGLRVGSTVSISGLEFHVAGLVNIGVRPVKADIYLRFEDAEKAVNRRLNNPLFNEMNVMLVQAAGASVQDKAIEDVKQMMQSNVFSSYNCYKPAVKALKMNQGAVWGVVAVLLLGVTILSMKSQWTTVIDRRREIGILKAIGWSDRQILSQILAESLLQSLAGGSIGCIVGAIIFLAVPLKTLIGVSGQLEPVLSAWVIAVSLLLSIVGGLFAGILPALGAARQNPAATLRE